MRILCFLSGSILSGKEYVALDAISGWLQAGHSVEAMFVGWHDGKFMERLQAMHVKCHPVKLGWYYLKNIKWSFDSLIHYPGAVRKFLAVQKHFRPDVLYVDSFRPVVLLAPFIKTKIVFHVHEAITFSANQRMFIKPINKRISKYIAVSDFIKKDLIASGAAPVRIEVIRNAITSVADTPKQYIQQNILKIGIVGQILKVKGHTDMLTACSMLSKASIAYKLYVFGSGNASYIDELKALATALGIESNIEWIGYVADKQKIYNTVDIVVVPSVCDEAFSLVAIEAGAHKVPVIATRSGALPENIIDNETGILVNKEKPQEIFDAIYQLYSHPEKLESMGSAARRHIIANYSLADMQYKMNGLLNDIQH
ncbi:hypothetical protein CAP35_02510 [Chitinophagaceae bacterium IBVUCB1]|nr:hypothetical protein CAP35_02510 [Chitinophagaceae bacterium IBVUCB1]